MTEANIFRQTFEVQAVTEEGEFTADLVTLGKINRNRALWPKDVKLQRDEIQISSREHNSVLGGFFTTEEEPVGAGRLAIKGGKIIVEGHYNLNRPDGVNAHAHMMFMKEHGYRQDWSIAGYIVRYKSEANKEGEYRIFQEVIPIEASPVAIGADTGAKLTAIQVLDAPVSVSPQKLIWLPGVTRRLL